MFFACALFIVTSIVGGLTANAISYQEYEAAVAENSKITIKGLDVGDGKDLNGRLYKPSRNGAYPAIVALHGAGGIFPLTKCFLHLASQIHLIHCFCGV